MKPKPFRRKQINYSFQQTKQFHTEDKCSHEYELYDVDKVQNKSYFRPAGRKPVGRFLSFEDKIRRKPAFPVGCRGPPRSIRLSHPQSNLNGAYT